ncbi:MAG: sensor histidine kinase [Chlorobi bacterium]|nr:sensor histidine kinase [Chlorobiota bacterium]
MKFKYYLIYVYVALCFTGIKGQSNGMGHVTDTAHINQLVQACSELVYIAPDSAFIYIDSLLTISKQENYKLGLLKAYNYRGIYFWMKNDLNAALIEYKQALKFSDIENYRKGKGAVLGNIAMLYGNLYNTDSAERYYRLTIDYCTKFGIKSLITKAKFDLSNLLIVKDCYVEAAENLEQVTDDLKLKEDSVLLIFVYTAYGTLYSKVNNFDMSLSYYKKAIEADKKIKDVYNIANTYINIGQLYFQSQRNYDTAMYYFRKSIEFAAGFEVEYIKLSAYTNIGNVYLRNKEYDSARFYYDMVLNSKAINDVVATKTAIMVNLGVYCVAVGNYTAADEYLQRGYQLADSLGILVYKQNALQSLANLKEQTNKPLEALDYYKQFEAIKDSISSEEARNKIAIMDFDKHVAKQKYNLKILEKENEVKKDIIVLQAVGLALFLLISMGLMVFIISLRRNRKRINELYKHLSIKNEEFKHTNEELKTLNEELNSLNDNLNDKQQQLLELNKAKDKFFSIIGHDLKSPYNSLLGFLDLLDKRWGDYPDAEKRRMISMLLANARETFVLLENLLNWGRSQQGLIKPNFKQFRLKKSLDQIWSLFQSNFEQKQIVFTLDISDDLSITTDERILLQILQNLINNAVKFTNREGQVTVSSIKTGKEIRICVSDTGIGFPKDKIPHIFDLDFDFNRPGTMDEKSSGMGLILCREYARIINAELSVETEENKGSTFCLSFKDQALPGLQ